MFQVCVVFQVLMPSKVCRVSGVDAINATQIHIRKPNIRLWESHTPIRQFHRLRSLYGNSLTYINARLAQSDRASDSYAGVEYMVI